MKSAQTAWQMVTKLGHSSFLLPKSAEVASTSVVYL